MQLYIHIYMYMYIYIYVFLLILKECIYTKIFVLNLKPINSKPQSLEACFVPLVTVDCRTA